MSESAHVVVLMFVMRQCEDRVEVRVGRLRQFTHMPRQRVFAAFMPPMRPPPFTATPNKTLTSRMRMATDQTTNDEMIEIESRQHMPRRASDICRRARSVVYAEEARAAARRHAYRR